ncbi:MAG: LytTR family transcriptional regulator, partial [Pseudomonadota bacterium]
QTVRIGVFGRSDVGERRLATLEAVFEGGEGVADAEVDLPLELRNQISRFAIISQESAGATALTDESVRRRRVGLTSGASEDGALRLVSNLHYLRAALSETADVVEGGIEDLLSTNPDVMALADVGRLTEPEREALTAWVEAGGMLIRFAGPRLARGADLAAADAASLSESDPLLPVNLRAGGRAVGGAMAWGAPQAIRDFNRESPFFGLTAPREVTVTRQILARLGPDLAEKTWAALEDGTPLVTSAGVGAGRVILFHVTANAEWSSLPLSGLFVDMMGRLVSMSGAGGAGELPDDAEPMRPVALMDGFGRASAAEGDLTPVAAARLKDAPAPDAPPGLYAGAQARVAYNLFP